MGSEMLSAVKNDKRVLFLQPRSDSPAKQKQYILWMCFRSSLTILNQGLTPRRSLRI